MKNKFEIEFPVKYNIIVILMIRYQKILMKFISQIAIIILLVIIIIH